MIKLRPHKLRVVGSTEGYFDEKRNYHNGKPSFGPEIACRYVPNGKARSIVLSDGSFYTYSYVVYLDFKVETIPFGTIIQLFDESGLKVLEKQTQGFHKGQLNAMLWI